MIAIIEQAVQDLRSPAHKEDAADFFHSRWYRDILDYLDIEPTIKPAMLKNCNANLQSKGQGPRKPAAIDRKAPTMGNHA